MHKRIWELDALRGLALLVMIGLHLTYDLVFLYRIVEMTDRTVYDIVQKCCATTFLLLSGICVTLGAHPVRRGLLVFSCGLVISAVTAGMYLLEFANKGIIIYFGVLHCLGACMLLWPVFRKFPVWLLCLLGAAIIAGGVYIAQNVRVAGYWLVPLGFYNRRFVSSDYFPLFPNLGYFLLGSVLGKTIYRKKQSLLPQMNENFFLIRFLRWCGKNSLWIYMLHQPVLTALVSVFLMLF
ncbi:MAG: DUF1624 domain-containing protein [Oscillospiraceae bacterium]|nr:DUF1624 domain-containing protein [Oscillospiraceae bacterium]